MFKLIINFLKYIKRYVFRFSTNLKYFLKNQDKPLPVYVQNNEVGPKIHIGAGPINLQGWINVDARPMDHIHIVSQNLDLKEFNDNTIQEIYMCHILEHIPFSEVSSLFKTFYQKLKKGGILRISVPSFDSIIDIYQNNNKNLNIIKYALMGGQDYEFNYHYSVYNKEELTKKFKENKFSNIVSWDTKNDFGLDISDWSSAKFKTKNGAIDISLNIKGIKN